MATENEVMTLKECADELRVTVRTLQRYVESGQLPAYKLQRVIRVERADWEAFKAALKQPKAE